MNKKERERLKSKIDDQRLKDRRSSKKRQERITELWQALRSGKLSSQKPTTELEALWPDLISGKLLPDKTDERAQDPIFRALVELVDLQDQEIEYLQSFRGLWELIVAHYPEQLSQLHFNVLNAVLLPNLKKFAEEKFKRTAKQKAESKRRIRKWPGADSLIEYQFGGNAEAHWQKIMTLASDFAPSYQPQCLDEIFMGDSVGMTRLEELFGIERHRLSKFKLPKSKSGRKTFYDYRAVITIMHNLLSETGACKRGRPRQLWLDRPEIQIRVLRGIEARMKYLRWLRNDIQDAFATVIKYHRSLSAFKNVGVDSLG